MYIYALTHISIIQIFVCIYELSMLNFLLLLSNIRLGVFVY